MTTATTHTMAFAKEKPSPDRGTLTSLSAGAALERDLAGGVACGRGFGLVGLGGVELRGIGGGAAAQLVALEVEACCGVVVGASTGEGVLLSGSRVQQE